MIEGLLSFTNYTIFERSDIVYMMYFDPIVLKIKLTSEMEIKHSSNVGIY